MNPADPVAALEQWVDHGARYRVLQLTPEHVVLQLCTCYGEPVDRLESSDPALFEYVRARADDQD